MGQQRLHLGRVSRRDYRPVIRIGLKAIRRSKEAIFTEPAQNALLALDRLGETGQYRHDDEK